MRDIVFVGPRHCCPGLHLQLLRTKGEVAYLDGNIVRPSRRGGKYDQCHHARDDAVGQRLRLLGHGRTHHCSGVSMMARRCSFCLNVTLAIPSIVRNLSSGTFMGPGDGADPGAGCGNAVERAVWKVTLPSPFCLARWIWPLRTVTEPNRLRYSSARALSCVPQPQSG